MRRLLTALVLVSLAAACVGGEGANPNPREQLDQILRRPLYQRWRLRQERDEEEGLMDSIAETVARWRKQLGSWLDDRLRSEEPRSVPVRPSRGGGSALPAVLKWLGYVAIGVVGVFAVFLIYRLIQERRSGGHAGRVLSREQVREALESGEALALGTPQWMAEADRLAQQGDLRAVFRALYLALLSGLHTQGRIDFRRSRTNWTYVRRFRGVEADRRIFAMLTSLFDRVWYGLKRPSGASFERVRGQVAKLLSGEKAHG